MAEDFINDLGQVLNISASRGKKAKHATNDENSNTLNMDDFLLLMVTQLQNQSIDNATDTSDMLNQMVQVSVIEAINNISNLIGDSTTMTYAASLVGKNVVVGQYIDNKLVEKEGIVLLKNENDVLPLSGKDAHISVFGKNSVNIVYSGSGSASSNSSTAQRTLYESLEAAGISYNETLKRPRTIRPPRRIRWIRSSTLEGRRGKEAGRL